jgi:hypothetical protein
MNIIRFPSTFWVTPNLNSSSQVRDIKKKFKKWVHCADIEELQNPIMFKTGCVLPCYKPVTKK